MVTLVGGKMLLLVQGDLIRLEKVCSFTLLLKLQHPDDIFCRYIQLLFVHFDFCFCEVCITFEKDTPHKQNRLVKENNCQILVKNVSSCTLLLTAKKDYPAFFCNCFAKQMLQHI